MPEQTNNERNSAAADDVAFVDRPCKGEEQLPLWLFRHNDLIRTMASAEKIEQKKLINILNFIHFKGDQLYILLGDPQYTDEILVKVHAEPCTGEVLTCRWDRSYLSYKLERYRFQYLILSHGQSFVLAPARLIEMNGEGLKMVLPATSLITSKRQDPRFICHDVNAGLWQNGFQAEGTLIDFSPHAFRIRVQSAPDSFFHWFNAEASSTVHLSNGVGVLYSGICNCLYQHVDGRNREIVLAPVDDRIQRYKAKTVRNPRRQSSPPLFAIFPHPFTHKSVQREIFDISTTGFSIYDKADEAVLIPGMIIPEMSLTYAGILKIHCKVQVIYRKEEEGQIRFGLVILDADLTNYKHLNQIINQMEGAEKGNSNPVDLEALWEFLFDADFIYPKKYKLIHSFKDEFQRVYRRLYEESPEIAAHFTYQRNGHIYGHISALRAYERSWLVHHHAARPCDGRPIGLIVLKQMVHYLYDLCRLPSANMEYCMAYFRPENEFPARAFGGFAEHHGNPRHCSLDLFAYMAYSAETEVRRLPPEWSLRPSTTVDLWEFERFYRNQSGGLFWSMLKGEGRQNMPSIEEIYTRNGFIRSWNIFTLVHRDYAKAFIIAEESDEVINLSNLLKGFKVFVLDRALDPNILLDALSELSKGQDKASASLMISPYEYVEKADLWHDRKQYLLWIMDMQWANEYIEYLGRKFRLKMT